jgi:predicted transcriptional regulator
VSSYPIQRGELTEAGVDGSWTVCRPENSSFYVLNESARAIWELCDGETAPLEMAEAIAELTGLSLSRAERDVESTLRELEHMGLVVFE